MSDMGFQCLVDALAEGRAAGLHIDLQKGFYTAETRLAFPEANKVAKDLRVSGLRNYWVAMTMGWAVTSYRQFCFNHVAIGLQIHDSMDVELDDIVFEKADQSLFSPYALQGELVLKADAVDTLIVTGVRHTHCVSDTVAGALHRAFKVFVVADATDRPMADFETYEQYLARGLPQTLQDNLSVIHSGTLREALFSARGKAAPVLS